MLADPPYRLSTEVDIVFETPDTHSHFFGFHDKSPFDPSGDRLLSHRVPFDGRRVEAGDTATVGYWTLPDGDFVTLGETQAFNWQQGSMLQWLPPEYDERVVYNTRGEGSFEAVIVDVDSGEERTLPEPIYAIHPSGDFALTVNFERMALCHPAYSYRGVRNEKWDVPHHEDDGIYRVDLDTGEKSQIVSTATICAHSPKPAFDERDNWLEQPRWNPAGTRFAFLHRCRNEDGRFSTRLFTADPDGSNLFMYPDTGLYSHMAWRNDRAFTIWAIEPSSYQQTEQVVRDNPLLNAIASPLFRFLKNRVVGDTMDDLLPTRAYIDFEYQSDNFEPLAPDRLESDGHPSWSADERWFLTDTYPLDGDYQHLLLWDDERGSLHELGQFFSHTAHQPHKCDLHPRWDRDYDRIAVDSAHLEHRQLVVLDQNLT